MSDDRVLRLRLTWAEPSPSACAVYLEDQGQIGPRAWSRKWDNQHRSISCSLDYAEWLAGHPDERLRAAVLRHPDVPAKINNDGAWRRLGDRIILEEIQRAEAAGEAWTPLLQVAEERGIWSAFLNADIPKQYTQADKLNAWLKQADPAELVRLIGEQRDVRLGNRIARRILLHAPLTEELLLTLVREAKTSIFSIAVAEVIRARQADLARLVPALLDELEFAPNVGGIPQPHLLPASHFLGDIVRHTGLVDRAAHDRILRLLDTRESFSEVGAMRAMLGSPFTTDADFEHVYRHRPGNLLSASGLVAQIIAHQRMPLGVLREIFRVKPEHLRLALESPRALEIDEVLGALVQLATDGDITTLLYHLPPGQRAEWLPRIAQKDPVQFAMFIQQGAEQEAILDGLPLDTLAKLLQSPNARARQIILLKIPGHDPLASTLDREVASDASLPAPRAGLGR